VSSNVRPDVLELVPQAVGDRGHPVVVVVGDDLEDARGARLYTWCLGAPHTGVGFDRDEVLAGAVLVTVVGTHASTPS
jgi:hypothetical protein